LPAASGAWGKAVAAAWSGHGVPGPCFLAEDLGRFHVKAVIRKRILQIELAESKAGEEPKETSYPPV